jgi:glyoxylase-like metal-dependent hydrolase (beta-lactamase superfamily II)
MSAKVSLDCFVESLFGENAYVVNVEGHDGVWVIDPSFEDRCVQLCNHVQKQNKRVEAVILSHGHGDHIAGIDVVMQRWPDAALLIGREDAHMLTDAAANLSLAFELELIIESKPTGWLDHGTELTLGPTRWTALDTSGHSPGGRSLYCPEASIVITGDALFAGSVGRTDFPGSNGKALLQNIRSHLLTLPGETRVYSGHGPVTTIEKERRSNPFLAE